MRRKALLLSYSIFIQLTSSPTQPNISCVCGGTAGYLFSDHLRRKWSPLKNRPSFERTDARFLSARAGTSLTTANREKPTDDKIIGTEQTIFGPLSDFTRQIALCFYRLSHETAIQKLHLKIFSQKYRAVKHHANWESPGESPPIIEFVTVRMGQRPEEAFQAVRLLADIQCLEGILIPKFVSHQKSRGPYTGHTHSHKWATLGAIGATCGVA
ncbi:hypothetical protein J6590_016075 [Homalodisca vitripennis]|nr:hypothetical protein J6590_016075 [Homalodisca vitripennis]